MCALRSPRTLRTPRLLLDAPREGDIAAVFAACSDPEVLRWIPLPDPYKPADAEFFVRDYAPHGLASGRFTVWALRTDAGAPLCGVIEVRRDEAPGSASIGCWLAPEARGRGLMREALGAVAQEALDPDGLGFERLRWEHLVGNAASKRLAESAGFDFGAAERKTVDFRGERREVEVGLLRRDAAAHG